MSQIARNHMSTDTMLMPPAFSGDLFADDALRQPYNLYQSLRDTAPVVRLRLVDEDYFAIGRFKDVQQALRSPEALISGRGIGFNAVVNAPIDNRPAVESDGERHRRLRRLLNMSLLPGAIRDCEPMLRQTIDERISGLVDAGWVDGVLAVASHLPLEIVSHLVGLPGVNRDNMLRWASAAFNTMGPLEESGPVGERLKRDFESLTEVRGYLKELNPAELKPGSWTGKLFQQMSTGEIPEADARAAVSGFVIPSLDTTISAQSWLLCNLGTFPDEWERLRNDPSLISSAVLEGMRYTSVLRWFSRYVAQDYIVDGYLVPEGARVMVMYQCANRDGRRYPDADRFDVSRKPTDQLGWGTGPHMCAGMHLAKLEMEALLHALVRHVRRIEIGEPVISVNRSLYTLEQLPIRLVS
jgi:cytochrome P450